MYNQHLQPKESWDKKEKPNVSFQELNYFLMGRACGGCSLPWRLWLAQTQLSALTASGPGAPWPDQQCCLKNAGQQKTQKDVRGKTAAACGAHGFQPAPHSLTSVLHRQKECDQVFLQSQLPLSCPVCFRLLLYSGIGLLYMGIEFIEYQTNLD